MTAIGVDGRIQVSGVLDRVNIWAVGLRDAAMRESDRHILWIPVAFAVGVGIYFGLPSEPIAAMTILPVLVSAIALILAPHAQRWLAIGLFCVASGFGLAHARTLSEDTPSLNSRTGPITIRATVEASERRHDGSNRLLLSNPVSDREDIEQSKAWPNRIRLTVRTQMPNVGPGTTIRVSAVLLPPPQPVSPGAFDFARQAYFEGLGAVGFSVSDVEIVSSVRRAGISRHVQALRESIAERIRSKIPGESGALAAALLTGLRGTLPEDVTTAMREAGLAHLLAISGLHVGLVTAAVFFVIRALLAAIPAIAVRTDIKRPAALVAWIIAGIYVVLAGATVPTLRAFIMTSMVLLAILIGRQAISMRLVAAAAIVILVTTPEALISVSFQMSFAAVIALVAVYEWVAPRIGGWAAGAGGRPIIRKLATYFIGIVLTTLIAEAAIAPFAAYHFHQIVTMGLLANLIAVPVMAYWIMPFGLLALLLMPVGLDSWALAPMASGIDIVISTARDVAALPGHLLTVPSMPVHSIICLAIGGLWICIWRSRRLKQLAVAPITIGALMAVTDRPPDILIGRDADLVAVRTVYGLHASSARQNFETDRWLEQTGGGVITRWHQNTTWHSDTPRTACDSEGCRLVLERSRVRLNLVIAQKLSALADDCARADILISWVPVRQYCANPAVVIDRFDLWREGAHAIWLGQNGPVRVESVAKYRGNRPWSRPPD